MQLSGKMPVCCFSKYVGNTDNSVEFKSHEMD